jgi:hypothetical protein
MPLYAVLAFYYNFYISERVRGREKEKIEVEGESERKKGREEWAGAEEKIRR